MDIKWIGHACFELKGKNISVVTDPFGDEIGFNMPKVSANILTISHGHFDHNNQAAVQSDIVFDAAGEFEFRGVRLRGWHTFHDEVGGAKRGSNVMFLFVIDGLSILHCGDLGHMLTGQLIDELGDIDVLLLPVGGNYTLPIEQAVELVHRLGPKVLVPMHFAVPGLKVDIAPVGEFLERLGIIGQPVDTLSLTKNTLPEEGVKVYLLASSMAQTISRT